MMPRLLTLKEAKAEALPIDRRAVLRFRNRLRSKLDANRFFEKAAQHCGVPNKLAFQAELIRACYPTISCDFPAHVIRPEDVRALLPEHVKAIKRIAGELRRTIVALNGLRKRCCDLKHEQNSDFAYAARGLEREARWHWQDFHELFNSLKAIADPQPAPPLALAFHLLDEVRVNLFTSSSSCRYEEAIQHLDHLLDNWSTATGLKQGKRASVQELDGLIAGLARFYAKTTGRRPSADKPFTAFVGFVVGKLPHTGMTFKNTGDQVRLKKRIQEALRHISLPTIFANTCSLS